MKCVSDQKTNAVIDSLKQVFRWRRSRWWHAIHTEGVNDEHNCTQDHLRRSFLSIMESVNWVCEEALEEHEWVSPLTVSLKEEEEVLVDLDYQIDFLCVVQ